MALWTSSYPVEAGGDRDSSIVWHESDVPSAGLEDTQYDLFSQFLDFEAGAGSGSSLATMPEPLYLDNNLPSHMLHQQQHLYPHHAAMGEPGTASSGVSAAGDLEFLSGSSNTATASYQVDPGTLNTMFANGHPAAMYSTNTASDLSVAVADSEIQRLQGISLHSPPKKERSGSSDPSSPQLDHYGTGTSIGIGSSNAHNMLPESKSLDNSITGRRGGNPVHGRGGGGGRKSRKFVEALSSTIRKATNMRKTSKVDQVGQRTVSPSLEKPPMAMRQSHHRPSSSSSNNLNNNNPPPRGRKLHTKHTGGAATAAHMSQQQQQKQQNRQFSIHPRPFEVEANAANDARFVTGNFDDPFGGDISPTQTPAPVPQQRQHHHLQQQQQHQQHQQHPQQQQQQQVRYYSQGNMGTALDSSTRTADGSMSSSNSVAMLHGHLPQGWHADESSGQQEMWWAEVTTAAGNSGVAGVPDAKNIDANMAMHSQHGELPYHVHNDGGGGCGNGGLMIHMPQPLQSGGGSYELALNVHTYLPPPGTTMPVVPPIPGDAAAAGRFSTRPPKAPSSGARHQQGRRNTSSSPMRKQRAASSSAASSPGTTRTGSMTRQSRQSSGTSSSSLRSTSGRLPGSVPGTPSGVKKRRSRDAGSFSLGGDDLSHLLLGGGGEEEGGGGASVGSGGAVSSSGGGGIGFVNFTPNDGSVLMTGVAPSGSSKTKARREKEAQERRRRLSEAAMKAVAAAGGDIQKLREQGFEL